MNIVSILSFRLLIKSALTFFCFAIFTASAQPPEWNKEEMLERILEWLEENL